MLSFSEETEVGRLNKFKKTNNKYQRFIENL